MQERIPLTPSQETTTLGFRDYMGVKLPMAEKRETAPGIEGFKNYVEDSFSRNMERVIATSWALSEPILVEGGTSLGKTTAVKKMCAELGYEVHYLALNNHTDPADLMGKYIPNSAQKNEADPRYLFADGSVTKALRAEKGKIKVLLLDEYNAAHPGVIIRLHEVLDAYKRGGTVTLTEDGNEVLQVDPSSLRIIALTNPAGGGFSDREPLDPAQIRRWSYHKLPDEVPAETFRAGVLALSGLGEVKTPPDANKEYIIPSRHFPMHHETLKGLVGMQEVVEQYIAFHEAAKALISAKKIANDQRQKFTFDDREEPRRVFAYISLFYSGDLAKVMRNALRYFYAGKVLASKDKQALEEMIRKIEFVPKNNPARRALGDSMERHEDNISAGPENKKEFNKKLREALRILGDDVEGPKEFIAKKISEGLPPFSLHTLELPVIPYTQQQLEEAKKNGQKLVFRTNLVDDDFASALDENTLHTRYFLWALES